MKLKNKKSTPVIEEVEANLAEVLNGIRDELASSFVARSNVAEGLILALICGQHVMLHGPAGTAKTSVAEKLSTFFVGDDFRTFNVQLAKGTKEEELFGPLHIKKLREDAVYIYHSKGKLPDCHFAILDETYRAPDALHPRMFGVLNERRFYNGTHMVSCPLRTAVGTTNFTSEDPNLAPFKDRWLINIKVSPLGSAVERLNMLVQAESRKAPATPLQLTLAELNSLTEQLNKVTFPKSMLSLYERLATDTSTSVNLSVPLTDRRLVWASRLAKASAFLNGRRIVEAEDLSYTMYGLITVDEPTEMQAFGSAYTSNIASIKVVAEETEELDKYEKVYEVYASRYHLGMSEQKKNELLNKALQLLGTLTRQRFSDASTQSRYDSITSDINELVAKLSPVNMSGATSAAQAKQMANQINSMAGQMKNAASVNLPW